ncbi:hypothetical protein [Sedimenticola selenatireducens]|uniref:hypothetical protein n=1 Tax=Sedimenticola selenatireducens TaxID=191960 RepID=UPI002AAB6ACA|nr:hypothetical protein [Sedimenticola selenatireducens]
MASIDVVEAYYRAMDAVARLNKGDKVNGRIRQLVEASDDGSVQFIRKVVQGHVRAIS